MGNVQAQEFYQKRADHFMNELINQIQENPLDSRIESLSIEYKECAQWLDSTQLAEYHRLLLDTLNTQIMMECSRSSRREDRIQFLKVWFDELLQHKSV